MNRAMTADSSSTDPSRLTRIEAVATVLTAVPILCAIFAPVIATFDPLAVSDAVSQPPPALRELPSLIWGVLFEQMPAPHWFGSDSSGMDVFSRTLYAARVDLVIAFSANILSFIVGVTLGVVCGFRSNLVTEFIARIADLVQSFPVFITAMILVALAGRTWGNIIFAMSLLYAPIYLRLTRTEALKVKARGFIEASTAMGNSPIRILYHHILPNSLGPAFIQFSVTIGFAILLTAGLSFVGAGVNPPTPEWGAMIAQGSTQLVLGDWWVSIFPGIAISLTVFGFALAGYALERRFET